MSKKKNEERNNYQHGEKFHTRPILTLFNGKCDCSTEKPLDERDLHCFDDVKRKR